MAAILPPASSRGAQTQTEIFPDTPESAPRPTSRGKLKWAGFVGLVAVMTGGVGVAISQGDQEAASRPQPVKIEATIPEATTSLEPTTTLRPTTTEAPVPISLFEGGSTKAWQWSLLPNASVDMKPYGDSIIQQLWSENGLPTAVDYFSPPSIDVYSTFSDEQWGDLAVQNLQSIYQVAATGEGYYSIIGDEPRSPQQMLPDIIHSTSPGVLSFVDGIQSEVFSYLFLHKPETTVGRYSSVEDPYSSGSYLNGDFVVVSLDNQDLSQAWKENPSGLSVTPGRVSAYMVYDRQFGELLSLGILADDAPVGPIELPIP